MGSDSDRFIASRRGTSFAGLGACERLPQTVDRLSETCDPVREPLCVSLLRGEKTPHGLQLILNDLQLVDRFLLGGFSNPFFFLYRLFQLTLKLRWNGPFVFRKNRSAKRTPTTREGPRPGELDGVQTHKTQPLLPDLNLTLHSNPNPKRKTSPRLTQRGLTPTKNKKLRPALGGELAARDPVWDGEGWGCDRVACPVISC